MSSDARAPAVVVVGRETSAGVALATGLGDLGAAVATVDAATLDGRDEFRAALERSVQHLGALDGVVIASVGIEPTTRGTVADLTSDAWSARVELPLRRTLVCFQGVLDALRDSGGTVVLLVPTLSLVGAAGFGPWAAVTEGQRALAKAAARAWGRSTVTVNCVAVPATSLTSSPPSDGDDTPPDRPGQPAPALERPDLRADVAPVVRTCFSPAWRSVTGATVAVDGGVWMTP
jgi:NAD(P)-dependent dehydrogenase (short-subunit alcohol dehydrogenase family)